MSVAIVWANGEHCPVILCDACGSIICEPLPGVVVFTMGTKVDDRARFYHKGSTCDPGPSAGGWMPMDRFLADLAHNVTVAKPTKGSA